MLHNLSRSSIQTLIFTAGTLLVSSFVSSAYALSYDERLERLERMAENNLYIQFSQRLNEQERTIRKLEDQIDILKFEKEAAENRNFSQFQQLNNRILELEQQLKQRALSLPMSNNPTSEVAPVSNHVDSMVSVDENVNTLQPEVHSDVKGDALLNAPTTQTRTQPSLVQNPNARMESEQLGLFTMDPRFTRATTEQQMQVYQKAFKLMLAGKRKVAIPELKAYVERFPESEMASSAQFWLGEAYFVERDYEAAYQAFKQNVEWYPESEKASDSIARAIQVQKALGNEALVDALKKELIVRYPNSIAAQKLIAQ